MAGLVLAHGVFTLAMCGLMCTVQLVVYPQFRSVDPADFAVYVAAHSRRIVTALALFAPVEVLLAGWLFLDTPPELNRVVVFVAGALLAAAWVATGVFYAPLHGQLQSGPYDRASIDRLIRTNWIRTALWLMRGGFAAWFLWQVIDT